MKYISLEDFGEIVGEKCSTEIIGSTAEVLKLFLRVTLFGKLITDTVFSDYTSSEKLDPNEWIMIWEDMSIHSTLIIFCTLIKIESIEKFAGLVRKINNLKAFL